MKTKTKKATKKPEVQANPENVKLLGDMWSKLTDAEKKNYENLNGGYSVKVAQLLKDGKVTTEDLNALHREYTVPFMAIVEAHMHVSTGAAGLTQYEARELAHRAEMTNLSYVESIGGDVRQAFSDGISVSIAMNKSIFEGTFDKEKVKVLQALPDITNWDKKKAIEAWPKIFGK